MKRAPLVADVVTALRRAIPPELGSEQERDWPALLYGDLAAPVKAIATCWRPTLNVLQEAASRGASLVVSHEPLFYEFRAHHGWQQAPEADKVPNRLRREVLRRHGMSVLRYHLAVDGWREGGTVVTTARQLGFEGPGEWDGKYMAAYDIPSQQLEQLAAEVRTRLSLPVVRVAGDPRRAIRRVAVAVGGFGGSYTSPEPCARLRADCVIFGEVLDVTLRHALELGLSAIETTHYSTETEAMNEVARVLRDSLPDVRVDYLETGMPWWVA